MTPREPDRYDAGHDLWKRLQGQGTSNQIGILIAALCHGRDAALDEAAQAILAEETRRVEHVLPAMSPHQCADLLRALASPAAAPAAETKVCVCRYLDGAEFMGKCPAHPAPPSEPAAPAPDLRCEACGDRLADEDAMHAHDRTWHGAAEAEVLDRIAELEAALRELTRAATEHANAHGCSGDLGARLSDAKALLAARTSPRGAGEGT